jgi:hypothetical protein
MNNDNNSPDDEQPSHDSSILKQEEYTDRTLLGEFGLAAMASLFAFFSAVLTIVIDGHSAWRPFWLTVCIISVLFAGGLIAQAVKNFGRRP